MLVCLDLINLSVCAFVLVPLWFRTIRPLAAPCPLRAALPPCPLCSAFPLLRFCDFTDCEMSVMSDAPEVGAQTAQSVVSTGKNLLYNEETALCRYAAMPHAR